MKKSSFVLVLLWLLTRAAILFTVGRMTPPPDIDIYFRYASNIFAGLFPYRDFALEYPPGVLPFFLIPRIFAETPAAYQLSFMLEMMVVDGLCLGILMWIMYRYFRLAADHAFFLIGTYLILPVLLAGVAYTRFDFIPAFFTLLAVAGYFQERRWLTWLGLSLGALIKLYPAVLAPVFLLLAWRRGNWRHEIITGISVTTLTTVLVWGPFLWAAGSQFWQFFRYHGARGIQMESVYATGLMVAHFMGLPVDKVHNFGSWNLVSPYAGGIARTSAYLLPLLIISTYYIVWRRLKNMPVQQLPIILPRLMLLPLLAFLLTGKVLSPQYMVWLMPFIPFLGIYRRGPGAWWPVSLALVALTFFICPYQYNALLEFQPFAVTVLVVRNLLLALLFYLVLKQDDRIRQSISIAAM